MEKVTQPMYGANVVPSESMHRWIWYIPPEEIKIEEQEHSLFGKWMIFLSLEKPSEGGLAELDLAWPKVCALVDKGVLMNAKCSTGRYGKTKGVVICYTTDYTDKKDVKQAADEIRQAVTYEPPLYYKTDEATYAELYRIRGDRAISIYKHTTENELFERNDQTGEWLPVDYSTRKPLVYF